MSFQNIQLFIDKIEADNRLQLKAQQLWGTNLDSVVAFARDAGFDFSIEEYTDYVQARCNEELGEDSLSMIANGAGSTASKDTQSVKCRVY